MDFDDLSSVPTAVLARELCKREAVDHYHIDPYEVVTLKGNDGFNIALAQGPVHIFIIADQ